MKLFCDAKRLEKWSTLELRKAWLINDGTCPEADYLKKGLVFVLSWDRSIFFGVAHLPRSQG